MSYTVVKEIGSYADKNVQRESHLINVDEAVVARGTGTFDLYVTNYVIVEALKIFEDGITYEETHVVASDEKGTIHPAVLYLGTRALTVDEAMFSIGEHNYDASIEPSPTDPTEDEEAGTNA